MQTEIEDDECTTCGPVTAVAGVLVYAAFVLLLWAFAVAMGG